MPEETPVAMTRRQMLAGMGMTVAGIALTGAVRASENADDTKDEKRPKIVLGSGEHKFECINDWLFPPDDILWGDTQGLAQDAQGRIYISHTVGGGSKKNNAIVVFDKNGKYLNSWGEEFTGGGHGLEIRKEGKAEFLYHCDTAHRKVVKTDLDGKVIWEKGTPTEPKVYDDKHAFVPTNVAFGPHGDFYIADGYGSNFIHQYNIQGDWIRTFGGAGTEDDKFNTCHGIMLDTRGSEPLLVITDRGSHRIKYFSLDGKYIRTISAGMRQPCHFSTRGEVMVIPDLDSVVTLVDKDNKVIASLGDGAGGPDLRGHPRADFIPGKFVHPHAAKFLHNGDILVVEWVPIGRVTLLKKLRA